MSQPDQQYPIDQEIELDQGTIVRVRISGRYTLEPGGLIDIDYGYSYVARGAMQQDEIEQQVEDRVFYAMTPALARDPEVAAHVQSRTSNEAEPAAAPEPATNLHKPGR